MGICQYLYVYPAALFLPPLNRRYLKHGISAIPHSYPKGRQQTMKVQFLSGSPANQTFQYIFARYFALSHPHEMMYMDAFYFAPTAPSAILRHC